MMPSQNRQFLAVWVALLASCGGGGGEDVVPSQIPPSLGSVELPLTPARIEEILATDKGSDLIAVVSANESAYAQLAGQGYARLSMVDPCVKRPVPVKSEELSLTLHWDSERSGFFPKTISVLQNPTTRFRLEYALAINSGERFPKLTSFPFSLSITSITNPSKDFKTFEIEAYPYWIRSSYMLKVPAGAFFAYPKPGSAGYIILTPESNEINAELCPN